MQLPPPTYLTASLPGTGGLIKQQPADFQVEEIPAYKPDGVGTHCYLQIQKTNLSTMAAADILAKSLGRKNFDIGYAGLKDKLAITSQWFSVEHLESARARSLELPPALKILAITRHKNKIKRGHLAGNRFTIIIRNPEWTRLGTTLDDPLGKAQAIIDTLKKTGTPNFFGPQRFGMRRDNHFLGLALLQQNAKDFTDRFLGDPDPSVDHGPVLIARQHYAKGELDKALELWPGHLRDERRALVALIKSKNNPKRALFAVDIELKRLMVSALQSYLFNQLLERRLPKMHIIFPGDFCIKHENGAGFLVPSNPDDAQKEQPRADAHEISPTGPLFGHRMSEPQGIPQQMESEILHQSELTEENLNSPAAPPGNRRPLRFFPKDLALAPNTDAHGPHLTLSFNLPPGSYATTLLAEIMKQDVTID